MPGNGGWTLILADTVALMLAFFVLSFSMREMIDDGPRPPGTEAVAGASTAAEPREGSPSTPAPIAGRSADQLQAPEQAAAGAPSFVYLAAILEREAGGPAPAAVRHDESGLVVPLPAFTAESPAVETLPRPLLALAFLARRFDLDLQVAIPASAAESLARRTERAMRLRDRLAAVTGLAAAEITFAAAPASAAAFGPSLAGDTGQGWAALQARTADAAASAGVRP